MIRLVGVLFMLYAGLAPASGIDQLHSFLTQLDRLQADFVQIVHNPQSDQSVQSRGTFYLQRPNQFRWDYSAPEVQQIVADGRQIWLYDTDLEQVSVQSQASALEGTPAMLLISGDRVEHHFDLSELDAREEMSWVQLIPKSEESQFTRILLAFRDEQLLAMVMNDKFDQVTRFNFSDIQTNPVFSNRFFEFEVPDHTDVYNR